MNSSSSEDSNKIVRGDIVADITDSPTRWGIYIVRRMDPYDHAPTDAYLLLIRQLGGEVPVNGWQDHDNLIKIPYELKDADKEVIRLYLAMQGVEFL